jgi:hypothetical protein
MEGFALVETRMKTSRVLLYGINVEQLVLGRDVKASTARMYRRGEGKVRSKVRTLAGRRRPVEVDQQDTIVWHDQKWRK